MSHLKSGRWDGVEWRGWDGCKMTAKSSGTHTADCLRTRSPHTNMPNRERPPTHHTPHTNTTHHTQYTTHHTPVTATPPQLGKRSHHQQPTHQAQGDHQKPNASRPHNTTTNASHRLRGALRASNTHTRPPSCVPIIANDAPPSDTPNCATNCSNQHTTAAPLSGCDPH